MFVLTLPIDYYLLEESSLVSFKNIEEAQWSKRLKFLKNRMNSFPVEIQSDFKYGKANIKR